VLVITNIEADHLDYYRDLADVERAFHEMALQVADGGYIVADTASPSVQRALAGVPHRVIDYRTLIDLDMPMHALGLHNRQNAAAARAVAGAEGIEDSLTARALTAFTGTWRRFEYKGVTLSGAAVYDDYAHHPTEIRATLNAAREHFVGKKILVAFHPHLYSRTAHLFTDFVAALGCADEILLAPIYAAREVDDGSTSSDMLAEALRKSGKHALAFSDFASIEAALCERSDSESIIITMGAGDIFKVADTLVAR
jgi:UDP-N-acetylmuramate--alanine ligase